LAAEKPHCRAVKPNGERCAQRIIDADGLCAFHSGKTDVGRAGRAGGLKLAGTGKAARKSKGSGYRAHLLKAIRPEAIARAIESGLESPKEADRLASARLLLAELPEPRQAPVETPRVRPDDRSASFADIARVLIEVGAIDAALVQLGETELLERVRRVRAVARGPDAGG
jgi:hypothetical protein